MPTPHMSPNRLEGSLCDTSLDSLLTACRKSLLTGSILIEAYNGNATIELRAGAVDTATFGDLTDEDAVDALCKLHDGLYQLTQRLPDFDGSLGEAAQFESRDGGVGLVEVMRHCEDNALSCTITVVDGFDRGQVVYRAGDIVEVNLNGSVDEDNIVALTRMATAKFQVTAPPLDLDVLGGWPAIRREPTAPFVVDQDAAPDPGSPETHRAQTAAERPSARADSNPGAQARGTDADESTGDAASTTDDDAASTTDDDAASTTDDTASTTDKDAEMDVPTAEPRGRAASIADVHDDNANIPWMIAGAGIALLAISLVYVLTVLGP